MKKENPLGFTIQYKPQNLVLREESPVDEFYTERVTPAFDCDSAVAIVNPLYVLFNQQRIEKAGSFAYEKWLQQIDSATKRSDSLKELRSKCSDDDLLSYLKSRYIQQPCEIDAWSSYINDNLDKMSAEIQEYLNANKEDSSNSSSKSIENPE